MTSQESNSDMSEVSNQHVNTTPEITIHGFLNEGDHPILLASVEDEKFCMEECVIKVFPLQKGLPQLQYLKEKSFAAIKHPHIIDFISCKDEENLLISDDNDEEGASDSKASLIFMEYAPFSHFFDLIIERKVQLSEEVVRTYFIQLLDALEFLHKNNMAHLDLKLENLMIGKEYMLKLIDFDLSYNQKCTIANGKGTADYRAPELKSGAVQNFYACDIYSLGIILFSLLNGKLPFSEDAADKQECQSPSSKSKRGFCENIPKSPTSPLRKLLNEDPENFWAKHSQLQDKEADAVTEDFRNLFQGLCAKNPQDRLTINQIKENSWVKGKVLTQKQLIKAMEGFFDKEEEY